MKKIYKLLLLLPLFVSCNKVENSNSSEVNSVTSSPTISSEEKISFPEDVTISKEDAVNDMEIQGVFLDISIGAHLVVDKTYSVNLSFPTSFSGEAKFEFSNPDILEIKKVTSSTYTLKALKQGGTILTIKDQDDIIFYRNAINSRNKLSKDEAVSYALNQVDYWESKLFSSDDNNYKLMFTSTKSATLEVTEMGVNYGFVNMELTYKGEDNISDYNEYSFSIVATSENEANPLIPTDLALSTVGDIIHLSEKNGIIDFFMPANK